MRYKLVGVAALAAMVLAGSAHGTIVELTYTEYARGAISVFQKISSAHDLDRQDAKSAEAFATSWFYIGPCRGDVRKLGTKDRIVAVLTFVTIADPATPIEAAVLEMIGALSRDGFGREPSKHTCRFALETAAPSGPPQ